MGYRGDDLDLRTPLTWSATPADLAGSVDLSNTGAGQRGGYRTGPIWVDETVLACSNNAFEVALAHRAVEVRLEHLLNALTRIDAAAEALEARGVRVAALRRDTATIIASEIPIGLPNGKGAPRRSEEFAEVLRLAGVNAARRNAPAGIEDVLFVLFEQRADQPGLAVLQRNTIRAVREPVEPLPPLTRYVPDAPRYMATQPADRYAKPEPARYLPEPQRTFRSEYAGTATDSIQNTRIDALEQMVRALSSDLASERQIVSGMLKDLSRDAQAHRDDQGRLQSGLYDRLQSIEQFVAATGGGAPVEALMERLQAIENGLEQRLNDMSRSWSVLSDRLQGLELAVRDAGSGGAPAEILERIKSSLDLKPISNRLDIIEEALLSRDGGGDGDVADRLKSVEGEIARALASNTASTGRMESLLADFEGQSSALAGQIAAPLVERITSMAAGHDQRQSAAAEILSKVVERMDGVERAVAAEIETAAAKHQAYAKDLTEVHDALMKLNQNQHTLAGAIDQWRGDAAGDLAVISNRLTSLDVDSARPMEALNKLTAQIETMNRAITERQHRRHRFWYWLFGTEDWIGASWPSQTAAVEADRQRLHIVKSA